MHPYTHACIHAYAVTSTNDGEDEGDDGAELELEALVHQADLGNHSSARGSGRVERLLNACMYFYIRVEILRRKAHAGGRACLLLKLNVSTSQDLDDSQGNAGAT
jgi:hypothetical protein